MIEKYIQMMQAYPIGMQIEVESGGSWEPDTVIGYKCYDDSCYLLTAESGQINSERLRDLVRFRP